MECPVWSVPGMTQVLHCRRIFRFITNRDTKQKRPSSDSRLSLLLWTAVCLSLSRTDDNRNPTSLAEHYKLNVNFLGVSLLETTPRSGTCSTFVTLVFYDSISLATRAFRSCLTQFIDSGSNLSRSDPKDEDFRHGRCGPSQACSDAA